MTRFPLYLIAFLWLLAACGNSEKARQEKMIRQGEELEKIKNELWEVHDAVMPKTSRIYQLKKCLQELMKHVEMTREGAQNFSAAVKSLENADKAMFEWMHDISDLEKQTDIPFEEQKKQYEAQLPVVEAVRDSMLNSIDRAENMLKEYEWECNNK